MALLLLAWIYHFLLFTIVGIGLISIMSYFFGKKNHALSLHIYFFSGILFSSVLLELVSFVYRINWEVHLFFLIAAIIYSVNDTKRIYGLFKGSFKGHKKAIVSAFLFMPFLLFILFHATDGPVYNLDPGRYHFQIINWAMHEAVVPGLANLHDRFGAMGNWHLIHAFSEHSVFSELTYHVFNSLIFLVLSFRLHQGLVNLFMKGSLSFNYLFDAIVLLLVTLYLNFIQYWFLSCPSTDMPNIVFGILAFSFYIENREKIELKISSLHVFVLSLICLSGFGIKLSALFLSVLLIKPAYVSIKARVNKALVVSVIAVTIVCFGTHILKNTVLSGWPLYPITALSFGNWDWQYPKEKADGWRECISHGTFSPEKGTDWNELDGFQKMEKMEMFKIWFKREFKAYNHIFYVVVLSLFILIAFVVKKYLGLGSKTELSYLYILLCSYFVYFAWVTNAPDLRFGLGYLSIIIALQIGLIVFDLVPQKILNGIISLMIIVVFLLSFVRSTPISIGQEKARYPIALLKHIFNNNSVFSLIGIPKTKHYRVDFEKKSNIYIPLHDTAYDSFGRNPAFYLPYYSDKAIAIQDSLTKSKMIGSNKSNLLLWDLPLPATHYIYDELELRGGDLSSGFRFNRSKTKEK